MNGRDQADPRPQFGGAMNYRGPISLDYSPDLDSEPDPGEIIWTWVPYEEDDSIGKDRPLLVIGRAVANPEMYVALMLSTKDHAGEHGWVSLGSGAWDRDRRESWVRFDRLLAVSDGGIRREGAVLERHEFLGVLDKARREQKGEQVD